MWATLLSNTQGMDYTVFTLQTHHTCLHLVSVHQAAPPLTSSSSNLTTAYYSFIVPVRMKGWVGLVSWPTADGLPISCRSGAGQGKFAGQRPTFYHWATPLTSASRRPVSFKHILHILHTYLRQVEQQTFSSLSFTGFGLSLVTASVISWPITNASSFVRPSSRTNMLHNTTSQHSIQSTAMGLVSVSKWVM